MTAPTASRGGAGVTLEQLVGALQLGAMLRGGSSLISGEGNAVIRVQFQSAGYAVDDVIVDAQRPAGTVQRNIVGIRRNPTIAADRDFVPLLRTFVSTFVTHRAQFEARELKLWLVVAGPHKGAGELQVLAGLARSATTPAEFAKLVQGFDRFVKARLIRFTEAVEAAVDGQADLTEPVNDVGLAHFVWELLRCLGVAAVEVEHEIARDRLHEISLLTSVTEGDLGRAATLWSELAAVAQRQNPAGAILDATALRVSLTIPVGPDQRHAALRNVLDVLESSARARFKTTLDGIDATGARTAVHLPRTSEVTRLLELLAGSADTHLVLTGPRSVGKSALAHAALDELRAAGAHARVVNAQDLAALGTASDPFHGRLGEVLGTDTTEEHRLLLIDGAEAGLEDDRLLLTVSAATSVGYRCLVVTRDDMVDDVAAQVVLGASEASNVDTHVVRRLSEDEVDDVIASFPALATAASRPRALELLTLPGVVQVLLRTERFSSTGARGRSGGPESRDRMAPPTGGGEALTEVEVFGRYWERIVSIRTGGASATSRGESLMVLAHSELVGAPPAPGALDGTAIDTLQTDGLLRPPSGFAPAIEFYSDLHRDYALVALLRRDGLRQLNAATQPRYAISATRLAVQAQLSIGGYAALTDVRAALADVAAVHGQRWAELADEALLGHPDAGQLLSALWPALASDPAQLLNLLATARRLCYPKGWGHTGDRTAPGPNISTPALRPLVALLVAHDQQLAELSHDVFEAYEELLVAYLRGVQAQKWPAADLTTVAAVQRVLAARPDTYRLRASAEMIALLVGIDGAWATTQLRERLAAHPRDVVDALESGYARLELARRAPDVLADLAEGYYIDPRHRGYGGGDGVRDHDYTWSGLGASANFGPFGHLLAFLPERGVPVIRALLRHASTIQQTQNSANTRAVEAHGFHTPTTLESHTLDPVVLDLPGLSGQRLVGYWQSWLWHRGSGVGPEPARSAAMAYERWLQKRIDDGEDLNAVLDDIYSEAATLSEVGIAHTLLLRNRPASDPRLAQSFRERLVSELEIGRLQQEYRLAGSDRDDPWRQLPPNAVAQLIAAHALNTEDHELLTALPAIADALIQAQTDPAGHVAPEVKLTASFLRPENWALVEQGGLPGAIPRVPQEVVEELAPGNAELDRFALAMHIQGDYSPATRGRYPLRVWSKVDPADLDGPAARQQRESPEEFARQFADDLAIAKLLSRDPELLADSIFGAGPECAVAAFVLTHAAELATPDVRAWATQLLLVHVNDVSPFEDVWTFDQRAPSRSAARGLPQALLDPGTSAQTRHEIHAALLRLAAHPAFETRATLAHGLRTMWATPCNAPSAGTRTETGTCHHHAALEILHAMYADARRRQTEDDPVELIADTADLAKTPPGDLVLPIVAIAAAAAIDLDAAVGHLAALGNLTCEVSVDRAHALATSLSASVVAICATGVFDGYGYRQMAAAVLRAAELTGGSKTTGAVIDLTRELFAASGFGPWRDALFDTVEEHHEYSARLAEQWVPLALEVVDEVSRRPAPLSHVDQVQLAAAVPPSTLDNRIDPQLGGLLPQWMRLAVGNDVALEQWARWAVMNDLGAAEILDSLDVLVGATNKVGTHVDARALFSHVLSQPLNLREQGRVHRWIDRLVAEGLDQLRDLLPES